MNSENNSNYILEMQAVNKSFGSVQVLFDVDLKIKRGTVHALIGENGAGKSTIVKIIKGVHQFDSGVMLLDGESIRFKDIAASSAKGIGMVYQELSYAPNMTVAENFFLGNELSRIKGLPGVMDKKAMHEKTEALLKSEGIDISPRTLMQHLSVSDIQMIEIIKVVSQQNAKIVIMDEPTSSLSEREAQILFEKIRSLKKRGVTIIYISHKLDEVKQIADYVTVMRDGHVVETGEIEKYDVNTIVDLIVGRKLSDVYPVNDVKPGEKIYEVKNLSSTQGKFSDVSFSVRKGEIIGLVGQLGSGRSEIVRALAGLDPIISGDMFLDGEKLKISNVRDAINCGVVMVSEDRQRYGILQNCSVKENASVVILRELTKLLKINKRKEARLVTDMSDRLNIKANAIKDSVRTLSGGNQQKVVLAKWLLTKPKVLILDEPTRGIDVGAKFEIYNHMISMAREGIAIIMISSELNEVISMSSRLYLIKRGRILQTMENKEDFSEDKVLKVLVGGAR